jgi:iron complex outermembrane recepter protein
MASSSRTRHNYAFWYLCGDKIVFKKTEVAVALATIISVSGSTYAVAQTSTAQPTPQKVERVEVTGTNIKRTDTETASPVQVVSREDIQRSGAPTIGELLRNIPANNAGSLTEVGAVAAFGAGASSVSLRGLGGRATLVLINGRRVAPYGFGGFSESVVDLNSIPAEAIERVEILKDGASAIYGSDAIAGVVNLILRRDYKGAEVSARYGISEQSDAKRYTVRGTVGFGDIASDKFNVFLSGEHYKQDPLLHSERRSSDFRDVGYVNRRSTYSYPGNFYTVNPTTGGTFLARNGTCIGYINLPAGQCLIDTNDYTYAFPQVERNGVFGRATYELSPSLSLFAELGASRTEFTYQLDPQFYTNDEGDWGIRFEANDPRNPTGQPVSLRYRAGDVGPRKFNIKSDFTRAVAGLKGNFGAWDWEIAGAFTESKTRQQNFGNIITAEMERALANGFVPGNRSANGEAVYSRISPTLTNTGLSDAKGIDAKVSREIGSLPGGPIGLAIGGEYRKESFNQAPDLAYQTGAVFGSTSNVTRGERDITAVFAEVSLPVLKNLEAQLAIRTDKYSGIKRSTTPKVGVKYVPVKELALRATYAQGFAAPTFQATTDTVNNYFTQVLDPKYCINGDEAECSWPIAGTSGGNKSLKPETSDTFTLGLVFEPTPAFSATLDYYSIDRKDEVSQLDITYLLENPQLYPGFVVRGQNDRIVSVNTPYVNIARTKTTGLDLELRGKVASDVGTFRLGTSANYVITWETEAIPGSGLENYNGTWNQPRWRATAYAEWERGPWVARLSHSHVGGFAYIGTPQQTCPRAQFVGGCEVAAWGTNDVFVAYKGFKNLELNALIANIEDRGPPADFRSRDSSFSRYNRFFHNNLGRMYYVGLGYKFR